MIASRVSRVRPAPRPAIRPLPSAQVIRRLPSAQFRSALASSAPEPTQPNRHAAPLLHCAVSA